MKTNHRRKIVADKGGYDYGYNTYVARFKVGLGADHDGGRRGSAEDIREAKRNSRVQQRRRADRDLQKEVKQL